MRNISLIVFICWSVVSFGQVIPFDSDQWEVAGQGVIFDRVQGYDCLYLQQGSATLKDVEFEDGVIEFDMLFGDWRAFPGVAFRIVDDKNYENFYVRPFLSGKADANQYQPVFNGVSAWQLYHGKRYASPVTYTYDEWVHYKLVVSGTQAEVYIGDMNSPALFIDELRHGLSKGGLGISVSGPKPIYFANFAYQKTNKPTLKGKALAKEIADPNTIMNWEVSNAFAEKELESTFDLNQLPSSVQTWTSSNCESNGLINLAKVGKKDGDINTVFARIKLNADQKQIKELNFGYSDRVRVYLNGKLLYSGQNEWRSRDYRYLGTVGFFDSVYLNLKKGENELLIAVSENFGGWGLKGKLNNFDGLSISKNP